MNNKIRKVIGLIRVSTKEQAADGRAGIARQREVINRTIAFNQLNCIDIKEINDVSGTNVAKCPEIQAILAMVKSHEVDGVVVADLDRLLRPDKIEDMALLQVFQDSGAILYCGDSNIDLSTKEGFLFGGIRASVAGYELKLIKERMLGAKEAKRRQGKCPSAKITLPLGVDYDRSTERFSYSPDVSRVVEAFRLIDEDAITNISEIGRLTGIQHRTLSNLLRNPIYSGYRAYLFKRGREKYGSVNGRQSSRKKIRREPNEIIKVKVLDNPAVSEERFERVRRILSDIQSTWQTGRKSVASNLGTGVLVCGHCRSVIYCSSGKRKDRKRQGYYYCKRNYYLFKPDLGGCNQHNIRRDLMDQTIESFIHTQLVNRDILKGIIRSHYDGIKENSEAIPAESSAIAKKLIDDRRKRLIDAYEKGLIPIDDLHGRLGKLDVESRTLPVIKPQISGGISRERLIQLVVKGASAFARIQSTAEKNGAIKKMFSKIIVSDASITGFMLHPSIAAFCAELGSPSDRDSSPPPA